MDNAPGSRANNMHSPGSNKLPEVHLHISTPCLPRSRVIQAFSEIEKHFFLFSDLAVNAAKSEKNKLFNAREGSD